MHWIEAVIHKSLVKERGLGALEATAEEPLLPAAATTPSGGGAKQRVHARPGPGQ